LLVFMTSLAHFLVKPNLGLSIILSFIVVIALSWIFYFFLISQPTKSKKNYFLFAIHNFFTQRLNVQWTKKIAQLTAAVESLSEEKENSSRYSCEVVNLLEHSRSVIVHSVDRLSKVMQLVNRMMGTNLNSKNNHEQLDLFGKSLEAMFSLDKSIEATINEMKTQSMTLQLTFDAFDMTTMSMEKVDAITKQAKMLAEHLSEAAIDGAAAVDETALSIKEISASSLSMEEFVVTIKNISEKTNLLAMNAAIEAAHAGEHGKGFAVVASEVRKLAMSTNSATNEIKKNIKQVLNKINNAVELVSNTETLFKNILEDITSTNELNQEIYEISRKNVVQGREIITAVNQLRSIAHRIIEASADELFKTNEVVVAMNEINSVVRIITQALTDSHQEFEASAKKVEADYHSFQNLNQDNDPVPPTTSEETRLEEVQTDEQNVNET